MRSLYRFGEQGTVRPTLVAFGILLIYAISDIYLEGIVRTPNLLLKTGLSLIYFFICVSPLIYFWLKGRIKEKVLAPITVLCLAVLFVAPPCDHQGPRLARLG
jgi:hypothetical protein